MSEYTGSGPTTPPMDVSEEQRRLSQDAAARGVDPDAAFALAEQVAHILPKPDAYRAVDRRIAGGASLEETRAVLLAEASSEQDPGSQPAGSDPANEPELLGSKIHGIPAARQQDEIWEDPLDL